MGRRESLSSSENSYLKQHTVNKRNHALPWNSLRPSDDGAGLIADSIMTNSTFAKCTIAKTHAI